MDLQEIVVYDKQNYFCKFLKLQFINYSFKKVKNEDDLNDLTNYSTIVFVLYTESELFDLSNLRDSGKQILVCSFNSKILDKVKKMDKVTLIDSSKTKKELVKELRVFFKTI